MNITNEVKAINEIPLKEYLECQFKLQCYDFGDSIQSYEHIVNKSIKITIEVISDAKNIMHDTLQEILEQENIKFFEFTKRGINGNIESWVFKENNEDEVDKIIKEFNDKFEASNETIEKHIKYLKDNDINPTDLSNEMLLNGFFSTPITEYLESTYLAIKNEKFFESPVMDLSTKRDFWNEILRIAKFNINK